MISTQAATREAAPHLRQACRARLDQVESRAAQLGEEDSTGDPARVVLEAVLLYAKTYATLARDGAVGDARWLGNSGDAELRGAARLAHVFERVFAASLAKADPLDGISDDDVRACLLATSGASPALFAPEKAFYALVRQQIQRLRDPGLECVDLVCRELENCAACARRVRTLQSSRRRRDLRSTNSRYRAGTWPSRPSRTRTTW